MNAEQHQHVAAVVETEPPGAGVHRRPHRVAQYCACGHWRYRVTGGPWTPWEPWDEADGPNPVAAREEVRP